MISVRLKIRVRGRVSSEVNLRVTEMPRVTVRVRARVSNPYNSDK